MYTNMVVFTSLTLYVIHVHTCTYCTQEHTQYSIPHPLKDNGLPVVVVPLLIYTDDTSGNRSKKWNKFDCWCFMLAGLPRHMNAQLHNIHFISCSNQAHARELMEPLVAELKMLEQGVPVYDAHLQQEVLVVAPVLAFLCDNPRHSELLNHAGGNARKYCRMCMVREYVPILCIIYLYIHITG